MNIGDILVGAAVLVALLLALGAMSKHQQGGCSGNCAGCSSSGSCANKNKEQ